jgi:molybdopterin synthase catalytic subunit
VPQGRTLKIRVLAFARLRELLGFSSRELDVDDGATVADVWARLAREVAGLDGLRASTRFARNGALAAATVAVRDGDEIALLPPVGGG